ncbi:hypothetical protein ACFRQM_41775 [Streptomyces sp. NPDC056831]|uniref:hypothetical protein n=1 Tax=Streptomyces sp. NPDC056831 TaxID=3345954 RepID=UPI003681979A
MDADTGSRQIAKGYSGAAVWDDVHGGVVGPAVAAGRGDPAGSAFLVPSESLVDEEVLRPACPFRSLEVFEEDAELFHGREDGIGRLAESIARRPLSGQKASGGVRPRRTACWSHDDAGHGRP